MLKKARFYILIFIVVLLQYGNTFNHDYAWDDAIVITQNERVQNGLENPSEFFRNVKSDEIQYRYGYRPISLLSFASDIEMSGMTPKTGHVMNVLYYGILCCLIFYFLNFMFPEKNKLFSLIIVGLFLVHPVHTEVVANIKSRDEILTMLFGVLSLIFFLKFLDRSKTNWLFGFMSLFALVLSFLSKENGITFVGLLLLVAYFRNSSKVNLYIKFAFPLLGGIILLGIRNYVYSDSIFENNTTVLLETFQYKEDGFLGNPLFDANGFLEILPNVFNILMKDYGLLFFPAALVHDYGYSLSTLVGWSNPLVILSIIIHLGLIYIIICEFKKKSILLFGLLFYFTTLSVYLHIIQIGPDYMGERYLFIPSLGFLIALVILIERFVKGLFSLDTLTIWKNGKAKSVLMFCGILMVLGFSKTISRNKAWENNKALLEADIEVLSNCARAQYNYATLLHNEYYKAPSVEKEKEIVFHYKRAVEISDRSMKAMLDLGSAYMEFGEIEKGKAVFQNTVHAHQNLVAPLIQMGKFYMSQNRFDLALSYYLKAEKISDLSEIYYSASLCLMKLGRVDDAIEKLKYGEKTKPIDYNYFDLLCTLEIDQKQFKQALISIEKALNLEPNSNALLEKKKWILSKL